MGLICSGTADVEIEADDDDVVAYVLEDADVMRRVLEGSVMTADAWAEAFSEADAVGQEQMLAALRRVCPHLLTIFEK
jgi:hypothetical protein